TYTKHVYYAYNPADEVYTLDLANAALEQYASVTSNNMAASDRQDINVTVEREQPAVAGTVSSDKTLNIASLPEQAISDITHNGMQIDRPVIDTPQEQNIIASETELAMQTGSQAQATQAAEQQVQEVNTISTISTENTLPNSSLYTITKDNESHN